MSTQSLDTVRRLAVETLNVPASTLLAATSLKEAGIDSLAIIDLVFTIEAHFGITLAPDDIASMRSLRDLAVCVDRLTAHEARRHGDASW